MNRKFSESGVGKQQGLLFIGGVFSGLCRCAGYFLFMTAGMTISDKGSIWVWLGSVAAGHLFVCAAELFSEKDTNG